VAVAAACLSAVLLGTIAEACSCGERTLCETFDFASVVVRASALSRSNITNDTSILSEPITYGVNVTTFYKEEPGVDYGDDTLTFITESGGSFCGVYLELDTEYLLDLTRDEGDEELHSVSCGLVRVWSLVDDADLADLESGCGGSSNSSSSSRSSNSMTSDSGGGDDGGSTTADDGEGGGDDDGTTDGDDGGADEQ
ncbi:unnamed protein product, partial [Laminaria digitata]